MLRHVHTQAELFSTSRNEKKNEYGRSLFMQLTCDHLYTYRERIKKRSYRWGENNIYSMHWYTTHQGSSAGYGGHLRATSDGLYFLFLFHIDHIYFYLLFVKYSRSQQFPVQLLSRKSWLLLPATHTRSKSSVLAGRMVAIIIKSS